MKTFRNLTYALVTLCVLSLGIIVMFTDLGIEHPIIMYVNSAVFAVALVALCASVIMYFHSKSLDITRLKRRGTRAYGELLQHKMRLIDAMDGDKPVADWDSFLYNGESFPRIRKFLYEEYFLLLSFDAFFPHSAWANVVHKFTTCTRNWKILSAPCATTESNTASSGGPMASCMGRNWHLIRRKRIFPVPS